MKLIIAGSRTFGDAARLETTLEPLRAWVTQVITGGHEAPISSGRAGPGRTASPRKFSQLRTTSICGKPGTSLEQTARQRPHKEDCYAN
jgi:hypothetical protein